jgi:ABC-type glycerol-3-phosphate transport system substrate-binding protein
MKKLLALLLVTMLVLSIGPAMLSAHAEDALYGDYVPAYDTSEPFEFTLYMNYEWWQSYPAWGSDEISAYWAEKFNMKINFIKAESSPEDQFLQLLVMGELPDVILMDRGATNIDLIRQGVFLDLAPLMEVNPTLQTEIAEGTLKLLSVDDALYAIPHWARKGPTGGNDMWLFNKNVWEAVGSPELNTFEELYDFAIAIRDADLTNMAGAPITPFAVTNRNDAWEKMPNAIYRSFGGPNQGDFHTIAYNGEIMSVLRDPTFKKALMEANKWYREDLLFETQFVDLDEQMIERFASGRVGLLYYDHSMDASTARFRKILMETEPGNDWIRVLDPVYPPAAGVEKTYADEKGTMGWNVHGITRDAKNPQRIFDFLCYMLTKEGSIDMMYGPPGVLYDELDELGNPILFKAMAELTAEENEAVGTWTYSFCNHSDNVDITKFAVNKMQPEELQDWVEATQSDYLTPIMFTTDEYANLAPTIDRLSDLGIARHRMHEDMWKEQMPMIIMASTAEEASDLYDALLEAFIEQGLEEIEEIYTAKYQENVALQGFSAYEGYGE